MTISRAEYESQQTQLTELKLQNQWLLEQLGLAKKRQFGSSSEKMQEDLIGQLSLNFNRMEEIGKEVHRSLQMEPPRFWIREDVYYTYACKNCELESGEANIVNTPKEPILLPGSFASAEAVAHIMTQKFVMYSPLYRLEKEFGRQGLKLSRQTMSNWLLNISDTWLRLSQKISGPLWTGRFQRLLRRRFLIRPKA